MVIDDVSVVIDGWQLPHWNRRGQSEVLPQHGVPCGCNDGCRVPASSLHVWHADAVTAVCTVAAWAVHVKAGQAAATA